MDHPKFIVSNPRDESISIQKVNLNLGIEQTDGILIHVLWAINVGSYHPASGSHKCIVVQYIKDLDQKCVPTESLVCILEQIYEILVHIIYTCNERLDDLEQTQSVV